MAKKLFLLFFTLLCVCQFITAQSDTINLPAEVFENANTKLLKAISKHVKLLDSLRSIKKSDSSILFAIKSINRDDSIAFYKDFKSTNEDLKSTFNEMEDKRKAAVETLGFLKSERDGLLKEVAGMRNDSVAIATANTKNVQRQTDSIEGLKDELTRLNKEERDENKNINNESRIGQLNQLNKKLHSCFDKLTWENVNSIRELIRENTFAQVKVAELDKLLVKLPKLKKAFSALKDSVETYKKANVLINDLKDFLGKSFDLDEFNKISKERKVIIDSFLTEEQKGIMEDFLIPYENYCKNSNSLAEKTELLKKAVENEPGKGLSGKQRELVRELKEIHLNPKYTYLVQLLKGILTAINNNNASQIKQLPNLPNFSCEASN